MGVRVRYGPLAKAADLIVNRIEDAKRMARPVVVGGPLPPPDIASATASAATGADDSPRSMGSMAIGA